MFRLDCLSGLTAIQSARNQELPHEARAQKRHLTVVDSGLQLDLEIA